MAKLLKLRRGTTSQHSSFTGAEGEVTVDTDKDVLVVNDGSTAGGHPLAAEDMSNVSSASIVGQLGSGSITATKLATDSVVSAKIQNNAVTQGKIAADSISANLLQTDSVTTAKIANGNVGTTKIADDAVTSAKLAAGAVDVTALGTNAVTTAKIAADNVTTAKIANDAVTFAKIQNIAQNKFAGRVSSGTGDLEQLTATDVRSIINVEDGATADQTKSDIDALNINADQVDSLHASSFARSDADDTLSGDYIFSNSGAYPVVIGDSSGMNDARLLLRGSDNPYIRFREGNSDKAYIQWNSGGFLQLTNQESEESLRIKSGNQGLVFVEGGGEYPVFHTGNDGSGSGLDADTVDGIQGANFLRSDTADTAANDITFSGGGGAVTIASGSDIRGTAGTWTGEAAGKLQWHSNHMYFQTNSNWIFRSQNGTERAYLDSSGNFVATGNVTAYSDARLKTDIHTINDALGICGKLRGVSYKWLENGKASIGVIAQEVEEILPEVVLNNVNTDPATGKTTEVKSVDYGKIVGVLINAINELKAEVDELKGGK